MKKLYSILFVIILLFAVKSEKVEFNFDYISTYGDYFNYYNNKLNVLSEKHSTRLLSLSDQMIHPSVLKPLLGSVVIIDTTIVNHFRKNGDYYIRTANSPANNILCELKCNKEIYNSIGTNDRKHFLLAVKINSIKSNERLIELDSIDHKSLFVNGGRDVALYGDCIDAVELPFSMIFAND